MFSLLTTLAIEPQEVKRGVFELYSPLDVFIKPQQYRKINLDLFFDLPAEKFAQIFVQPEFLYKGLVSCPQLIKTPTEIYIEVRNVWQIPSATDVFSLGELNARIVRKECLGYLIVFEGK